MTDEELALEIAEWKSLHNPFTGKNYGLRTIAEELGITYAKARYLDDKYEKPSEI